MGHSGVGCAVGRGRVGKCMLTRSYPQCLSELGSRDLGSM